MNNLKKHIYDVSTLPIILCVLVKDYIREGMAGSILPVFADKCSKADITVWDSLNNKNYRETKYIFLTPNNKFSEVQYCINSLFFW